MTEWHRRYRGPGVMINWHVEGKSLCAYSQLKSCSAPEVAAMIEGVLRHCTDVEIDRQYTDTHGASIVGFAFAHTLGLNLLPRLKNVGSARPYRPATGHSRNSAGQCGRHSSATTSPTPTCAARSTTASRSWRTETPPTTTCSTARTAT